MFNHRDTKEIGKSLLTAVPETEECGDVIPLQDDSKYTLALPTAKCDVELQDPIKLSEEITSRKGMFAKTYSTYTQLGFFCRFIYSLFLLQPIHPLKIILWIGSLHSWHWKS